MRMGKLLEVCVDSLASARAAVAGGADRLELCAALAVGGLTPYEMLLRQIKAQLDIPVRCLMHPRGGDFLYTPEELEMLRLQILQLKAAGADGFVIGCLTPEGDLDGNAMKPLVEACGDKEITLHRCIDVSRDLEQTYADAAVLGIDTVLTSGGAGSCKAGKENIAKLIGLRDEIGGPEVLIGAGVNAGVIAMFRREIPGAVAFHMSGKEDTESKKDKTTVFEWYYKRNVGGKDVLHYVKWCTDEVLYATENERVLQMGEDGNVIQPQATRGLYDHGKYPFVFDVLFPMEGTPTGAGYIDKLRDAQEQIDILNNAMLVNAKLCATPRWIVPADTQLNMTEFADWTQPFVHLASGKINEQTAIPLAATPMSDVVIATFDRKIDELKETGSNRDFANGSTASGVTSGAAIAALQEAGNKTSRSAIQETYDATEEIAQFVIDLIRQFYNAPRCFRITGADKQMQFEHFDNSGLKVQKTEMGDRLPIFDIKTKAHKQNPFSKVANNQDMINFYSMGFFSPAMADQSLACLEMLEIEGKEKLYEKISQNGTMLQMILKMQPVLAQLAQQVDSLTGSDITNTLAQEGLFSMPGAGVNQIIPQAMSAKKTNSLGEQTDSSGHPTVDKAREKVNRSSEVQ